MSQISTNECGARGVSRTTSRRETPLSFCVVLLALGAMPPVALAKPVKGDVIDVWVRGAMEKDGGQSTRLGSRRIALDKLPLRNVQLHDIQYGEVGDYRGISLGDFLARARPDTALDLAILHFSNGMAIPVPFRDATVMKRLDPFIVRGMRMRAGDPFSKGTFPALPKNDARTDGRPIVFPGNKIVVVERWHPAVAPTAQPDFSPWTHTAALTGIELAVAQPYNAQFDVGGDASAQRGLALFRESCQFCHGVRHVGASFGWDFVESTRIHSYQDSAANLYHNVAYKPRNATELGLMMPPLTFMTEKDAGDMRQWLQAIGTSTMPAYTPPNPRKYK